MYSCRVQCRLYISNMIGRKYCEFSVELKKKIEIEPNLKNNNNKKNNNMPSFPFLSFSNKIKNLKLCSWVKTFEKILNSGLFFMNSQDVCRCLFNVFLVFSSFKSWRQSRSPGLAVQEAEHRIAELVAQVTGRSLGRGRSQTERDSWKPGNGSSASISACRQDTHTPVSNTHTHTLGYSSRVWHWVCVCVDFRSSWAAQRRSSVRQQ